MNEPHEGDVIAVWFSCGAASAVAAKLTLERQLATAREALTPRADTKAAYIGEFSFTVTLRAGNQEDYRRIEVPWTTIKEIMAAILGRSALTQTDG